MSFGCFVGEGGEWASLAECCQCEEGFGELAATGIYVSG